MNSMSYFVVMIDHGKRGRESIVDPEITRRDVIACIRSGEYRNISFIHYITMNDVPEDVTAELIAEAEANERDDLPSDEARTAAYNAELINRYRTGQYLTKADKDEARKLIAEAEQREDA